MKPALVCLAALLTMADSVQVHAVMFSQNPHVFVEIFTFVA